MYSYKMLPKEENKVLFWYVMIIRIKSGEPCFLGFSVPGRLGGVICKPEGVA